MKKSTFVFVIAIIFGSFLITSTADASTIYVNSSTGDDATGDGSLGNPFATFTAGYAEASIAGDTLNLTGTFDWSIAGESGDVVDDGFVLDKDITILGQSATETFIQASPTAETADRSVFTIHRDNTVSIKNVTIRYGVSTQGITGGGITNRGTLSVENSTISDNHYNSGSYGGAGAIYSGTVGELDTYLTIASSTISNNTFTGSIYGAGGIFIEANNGVLNIQDSTIANNEAVSSIPDSFPLSYANPAGAVGARVATVTLTNSTIYGNTTNSFAGAMNIQLGNTTITNATIVGNNADEGAGGVLVDSVNMDIQNTIIANNTGNGPEDFNAVDAGSGSTVSDNGYNIVEYSTNKTWNAVGDIAGNQASLNVDSSLSANDSLTGVQMLALLAGSIAINAGTTTTNGSVSVPLFDQRGFARSGPVDIGAFEFDNSASSIMSGCSTLFSKVGDTTYAIACGIRTVYSIDLPQLNITGGSLDTTNMGSGSSILSTSSSSLDTPVLNIDEVKPIKFQFLKNLKFRDFGDDVRQLQVFLNTHGFVVSISGAGSSGLETNLFGSKTQAALAKYQKARGIKPALGNLGPITRSSINAQ